MITDKRNFFSDGQTVTTGSENGVLGDKSMDLGAVGQDIGASDDLWVVVQVKTAMAGTNPNATTVELLTDEAAALTTSPVVVQRLGIIPTNSVAGSVIVAKIDPSTAFKQHVGVKYTAANALSAGVFNAFVTSGPDVRRNYPNAFSIATS